MAKRKSLNRRSSRYSSTILNSNSDISSDEYTSTDWWKNLEDNTIRPSTASNILNQTSRQLDSNSQIKTSQVTDGWWKALEVTNISNSSKVNENIITKESSNNVLTSESEEESKIVRRKYFLRSKIRTSKDNIFLDALNNSITTSELTQKTGKESSINKSALSNKTDLNAEQSNEMQVSNLSDSLNTNDILKMKPSIFKKNNKNQNNNIFVNVLKKNQLESPLKRKSSVNEDRAQISTTEYLVPVATETSEFNEILQNQISLSFNNEHNFSHFPIPKAQSTILEGSSSLHNNDKESNNSDTNSEVLKPKSKLLTRHNKNVKENLFENIFEKQETSNKIKSSESTVVDDAERILNSSGISEAITDKSNVSNNISDTNHNLSKVRKSKSKFLKKLRKNQKRNLFQDIFEKNEDTSTSTLKHSLHLSEEENLYSSKQDKNKQIVNKQESELIDFRLRMSDEDDNINVVNISTKSTESEESVDKSKTKNVEDISKRQSKNLHNSEREIEDISKNKNLNKNIKKQLSLVKKATKIDSSENKSIRRSSRLHKLQDPSISSPVNRIEQEEVKNTTQRISRSSIRIQKVDKIGENVIEDGEDMTKSNNPNKLQKKSMHLKKQNESFDEIFNKSNSEDTTSEINIGTEKNHQNEALNKSEDLASSVIRKNINDTSKEQRNSSKLQKKKSMDTYSKRQSKIFDESDLSNTSEIELEKIETKSIKVTTANASFLLDDEKEKTVENHDEILNKSTDLISSVIGTYVEDNNISKKQGNDRSNKSQEKESVDAYSKTQNKIFDESDLSITFEIESDEIEKKSTRKTSITNTSSLSDNEKQKSMEKNRNEESDKSKNLMSTTIKKHIEDKNILQKEQESNRLSKLQNESMDTHLKRQSKIFNESKEIENKSTKRGSIANALFLSDSKKQKVKENDKVANKSFMIRSRTDKDSNVSKGQKSIRNFLTPKDALPASQILCDEEKVKEIRRELEKVKEKEMASMGTNRVKFEEKSFFQGRKKEVGRGKKLQKQDRSTKQIHRAFLVNGQKYKPPRLPRPQPWITDRLYKYLWKHMESRFKLETRLVSEKFIHQLSNVTKFIMKCKSYLDYENELYALMKEMARLGIISTRNDFYHFCQDFFLYELRVKIVPMILPGNKRNIPYDANKLNEPLLDS